MIRQTPLARDPWKKWGRIHSPSKASDPGMLPWFGEFSALNAKLMDLYRQPQEEEISCSLWGSVSVGGSKIKCLQPGGSLRGEAGPVCGQEAILESIYFTIWKEMWVEMCVFPIGKMTTLSKQQLKQLQHPGELGEGAVEHRPGLKWAAPIMPWVNTLC